MLSEKIEKKMKIQLYLHYPGSQTRLATGQLENIKTISSYVKTELSETITFCPSLPRGQVSMENNTLPKICTICFYTYIDKCIICDQSEVYARSFTTGNMKKSEMGRKPKPYKFK